MKVTLLGQASVLVELHGRAVLIDPVFGDTFADGAATSCPARRVHADRLPRIDMIVVSSSAPLHFDLPTLAALPRDCVVVCPQEPSITYALQKLGFADVRPTAENTILKLGKFELWATGSTRERPEFGVAIKDRTGTLWAQLDTTITPQLIDQLRARFGRVDLFLAAFPTSNMMYLGTARPGFPTLAERASVAAAGRLAPRLVVPASGGFRFVGVFEWTNPFLFPVSRERFVSDLAREHPDLRSAMGDAGDVFEIADEKVARAPGASRLVETTTNDTERTSFDLTAPVPPLTDPNLDAYPADVLDRAVTECMDGLQAFVEAAYTTDDALVTSHRGKGLVYGLGVVFPEGEQRWMRVTFQHAKPIVARGRGDLRDAETTHRIAASIVTAWWRDERSYPYLGGFSRRSMVLGASLQNGEVQIEASEPPDVLLYFLAYKRPGAAGAPLRRMDFRLRPLVAPPSPDPAP